MWSGVVRMVRCGLWSDPWFAWSGVVLLWSEQSSYVQNGTKWFHDVYCDVGIIELRHDWSDVIHASVRFHVL